jgi:hypothetical protein
MALFQRIFFTALIVLISCSATWSASLLVVRSGTGRYAIVGGGLNQVRGMDLTLAYDSSVLGSPVISWGNLISGAVSTANTGVPGSIRIAVISNTPLPENGEVAQIFFSSSNVNSGITSILAHLIDATGSSIPVTASIAAPQQASGTLTDASGNSISLTATDSRTQSSSSSTTSVPTTLGAVSMPTDSNPKSEVKPNEAPVNVPPAESSAIPDDSAARQQEIVGKKPVLPEKIIELKRISYASVLDRFKTFQGNRTPEAMMTLFGKPVAPELRQEPAIAVSDGITGVRIYANLPKSAGTSPNFSLSGVELVSLERDLETGVLVLEVLPKKNSIQSSVTILTDETVTTFPLTLIPAAVKVRINETTFDVFLKDAGTKKPTFDLNGDGVHDYLDDYIYTGQCLNKKLNKSQ